MCSNDTNKILDADHNIETIYIRLHAKKIKTVGSCPHYHTATRKMANYNI